MNELITIKGVRGRMNGESAELNLEDVARGLGFTQSKNGIEYVRWETVTKYLSDLGFSHLAGKDNFIPENIFYKLCFKASNETARKFQDLVTDEIRPDIRRHGMYATAAIIDKILADPDFGIWLLQDYKAEKDARKLAEAKNETLEIALNESLKYYTVAKYNKVFHRHWDMKTCQQIGKHLSGYCRARAIEIRKCETNDERFGETNSYPMTAWEDFLEKYVPLPAAQ